MKTTVFIPLFVLSCSAVSFGVARHIDWLFYGGAVCALFCCFSVFASMFHWKKNSNTFLCPKCGKTWINVQVTRVNHRGASTWRCPECREIHITFN